ncbi:NfeD family protein [Rariglobus hedericola]|uniref:Serine protease n=1 Tax=Rariglobus hedericola TaxID=2597822 RepID=A0A556QK30_9BACT|nr:NfeD family protein [Rariglobus hedericola]TSJ76978.1 serine protease [Rariglobus hedericola]
MNTIIMFFIAGAVLLAAEVFVPGAILGIFAAIALLVGVVLSFVDYGSMGGWIAIAAALGLTGVTLWFEFMILPKTALGRRLFLKAEISGASQPPLAERETMVGQAGVADTTLAPSGYVIVAWKRYEAYSRAGLIAKGETLRVVELDNFRLIVQKN